MRNLMVFFLLIDQLTEWAETSVLVSNHKVNYVNVFLNEDICLNQRITENYCKIIARNAIQLESTWGSVLERNSFKSLS